MNNGETALTLPAPASMVPPRWALPDHPSGAIPWILPEEMSMAGWRTLGILAITLALPPLAAAQTPTYPLSESLKNGDCFHIKLGMKLNGEWKVQRDDAQVPLQLAANAAHDFAERVLAVTPAGSAAKCARYYHQARAAITAGGKSSERTLRAEQRLVVAQWHKDQLYTFCPDGPLTRDEVETLEHFDTLHIPGLLPGKAVGIGETWKLANVVAQGLCGFDALIEQDLAAKLTAVNGDQAQISVTGTASGINVGAQAKLTVAASAVYDLKAKRVVSVEWKQKDERDQGPASPATAVEVAWTVSRTALEREPNELNDYALVNAKVPDGDGAPPDACLQLLIRDARDRFQLNFARDWHTTSQTAEHVILRLMERGDWVAQATITPWAKAEAGKHMTSDEFKQKIDDMPGWEAEEVLEDAELKTREGYWGWRVSALGEMDGLKVLQNFYVVAGPDGGQVVIAVTLRPALAQKLGTRDLELVDGVTFSKPK